MPGTVATLEDVRRLREEVDAMVKRLDAVERRVNRLAGRTREGAEHLERLDAVVTSLDADVAESRRLSLRIAQLADLVFDRLGGGRPGAGAGAVGG